VALANRLGGEEEGALWKKSVRNTTVVHWTWTSICTLLPAWTPLVVPLVPFMMEVEEVRGVV